MIKKTHRRSKQWVFVPSGPCDQGTVGSLSLTTKPKANEIRVSDASCHRLTQVIEIWIWSAIVKGVPCVWGERTWMSDATSTQYSVKITVIPTGEISCFKASVGDQLERVHHINDRHIIQPAKETVMLKGKRNRCDVSWCRKVRRISYIVFCSRIDEMKYDDDDGGGGGDKRREGRENL